MNQVRMAVIGTGSMGKKYAQMIAAGSVKDMVLTAVVCRSEANIEWAKEKLNQEVQIFPDADTLYAHGDLFDAVMIVTPHKLHPEMVKQGLLAGKHMFCDKPAGVSMKQCEEMARLAREKDLKFAMMFHQRMYGKYLRIKELLEQNEIGVIRRVMMENSRYYRTQYYHKSGSWRSSWTGEGGGALINQGQHILDIWQWLVGMPQSVQAVIPFGKYNDFDVDDEATILMEYPDKRTAVFILTTGEGSWTERLEIVGSKGTILLEEDKLTISRYDQDLTEYGKNAQCNAREQMKETLTVEDYPKEKEPYEEMLADFADAILTDGSVAVSGLEGLHALELTNAAYLSAFTGKKISLPMDADEYEKELTRRMQDEQSRRA